MDDLLLTRESEDNMADLAGNAMTSTVVGTCIMAALVLASEGGNIPCNKKEEKDQEEMEVDKETQDQTMTGEDQLVSKPLSLATDGKACLDTLCQAAKLSSRRCFCEGREQVCH